MDRPTQGTGPELERRLLAGEAARLALESEADAVLAGRLLALLSEGLRADLLLAWQGVGNARTLVAAHGLPLDAGVAAAHEAALAPAARIAVTLAARDGRPLGTLVAGSSRGWRYGDADQAFAHAVGRCLALAWERADRTAAGRGEDARFRDLAEAIPAPVWVLAPEGRPLFVNRRWREYFGAPEDCWIGDWVPVMHPDEREQWLADWQRWSARGQAYQFDGRLRRADGQYRWHRISGTPIRDAAGRIDCWYGVNVDIHDRVLAEQAMAASEARAAMALRAGGMGVWTWHPDTGEAAWDAQLEALIGVPCDGPAAGRAERFFERIVAEDAAVVRADAARVLAAGGHYRHRFRYRHPDGRELWLAGFAMAVAGDDGAAPYITGVNFDVTEQRRAEQALQASERALADRVRELDTVFNVVPVGLCVADRPEPDTLRINVALARLFGIAAAGTVDLAAPSATSDWTVWQGERRLAGAQMPVQRAARGESVHERLRLVNAAGAEYELEAFAAPLRTAAGDLAGGVGAFVDVSELVRAEQRMRQFAESDVIGILYGTTAGGIEYANDEFLRIVGYDAADLASGRLRWDALTPAEWLPLDRERVAEAQRAGACTRYEKEYVRKDGSRVPVLVGFILYGPLRDRSVAFILDLSDLKRAEQALREADRRKDEFMAVLGHELRGPLAPLMASLEVLQRAAPDAPAALRARATMQRQVRLMVRLVDDLMDVARVRRGQLALQRERVPLQLVLDNAFELARPVIDARGHGLTVHAPTAPVLVRVDPQRMAQVLANLLVNAAKYTPTGGSIVVDAGVQAGALQLRVHDNGRGIAPEHLTGVFELFDQGAGGADAPVQQGGLGIGLALARRLVELHGGTLSATSPGPGQGSTFTVLVPGCGSD